MGKSGKRKKERKEEEKGKGRRREAIFQGFARSSQIRGKGVLFRLMGIMYWYVVGSVNTYENPQFYRLNLGFVD